MSEPVSKQNPAVSLGVAIIARDSTRFAILRAIVQEAGHGVVEETDADVFLLDGENVAHDKPALVLGGRDSGQAGWLPADANARQIDAALRAIAAGLRVRSVNPPNQEGFQELPEQAAHGLLTPRELDVLAAISAGLIAPHR